MRSFGSNVAFALAGVVIACAGCGDDSSGDGSAGGSTSATNGPSTTGVGVTSSNGATVSGSTSTHASVSASVSGSTSTGVTCGDGVCSTGEDSASCCDDCGCAAATECASPSCTDHACDPGNAAAGTACTGGTCDGNGVCAPAQCGDGYCNGTEDTTNCCTDCACPGGSHCEGTACAPDAFCGDGVCNGGETESTCCGDCPCSSPDDTCSGSSCVCGGTTAHFENVLTDVSQYCFATNSFYTQQATAYVNVNSGGWVYMPDGGYYELTGSLGSTYNVQEQCCLIDVCGGTQTCPTPGGNYPCFCNSPTTYSVATNACGETFFPVCD